MKKFIVTVVGVIILLAGNSTVYAKGGYYNSWNIMKDAQKLDFFAGAIVGIQAMGLYANIPHETVPFEKVTELAGFTEYGVCMKQDFDKIYSQRIDIPPSFLFYLSFKKCRGDMTQRQFLEQVEKSKQ